MTVKEGLGSIIGEKGDLEITAIRVKGSFEVNISEQSKEPVCVFLKRNLTVFLSASLKKKLHLKEVRRKATGDEYCEFVNFVTDIPNAKEEMLLG